MKINKLNVPPDLFPALLWPALGQILTAWLSSIYEHSQGTVVEFLCSHV